MIGVFVSNNYMEVVNEFFQLFKIPWEFCNNTNNYRAIISTIEPDYNYKTPLWIIYNSNNLAFDRKYGLKKVPKNCPNKILLNGLTIPIYNNLCLFDKKENFQLILPQDKFSLGIEFKDNGIIFKRIGYDLFNEVFYLLNKGQPSNFAEIPTLDIHINLLRVLLVQSDVPVIEILPRPKKYLFFSCLTHDVDFVKFNNHKFDFTFWEFIFRSLFYSPIRVIRGQLSWLEMVKNWLNVLKIPLVFANLLSDFWFQFHKYERLEKEIKSTFYLIPYKNRAGEKFLFTPTKQRAAKYDVSDISDIVEYLEEKGFEIGLHGIDAWHDSKLAIDEKKRILEFSSKEYIGVRIHWLWFNEKSPYILDECNFLYDSSIGYNEVIGYRAGTSQVFKIPALNKLLELPLIIHDIPLFNPAFLNLSYTKAWQLCKKIIENAKQYGGVVTILWHLRSIASDRYWGNFYVKLIKNMKEQGAYFTKAENIIKWFQIRRNIKFKKIDYSQGYITIEMEGIENINPGFILNVSTLNSTFKINLKENGILKVPL